MTGICAVAEVPIFVYITIFVKKSHGSVAVVSLMFYTCLRVLLQRMVKQILVIFFLIKNNSRLVEYPHCCEFAPLSHAFYKKNE